MKRRGKKKMTETERKDVLEKMKIMRETMGSELMELLFRKRGKSFKQQLREGGF
jgi:delta 1-pyrroline-5-carboxylate dehydrogenase